MAAVAQKQREIAMDTMWMYVYCASLLVSCLATVVATYHMRQLGGDMLRSTVRFVVGCFLISSALHALAGGFFYAFLIAETHALAHKETTDAAAATAALAAANATTTAPESAATAAMNAIATRLLEAAVFAATGSAADSSDIVDTHGPNAVDAIMTPDDRGDGGEAAYISKLTHDSRPLSPVLTTFLLLENMFFLISAYWIVLVTTELFKLAMATLDRGMASERAAIRKYSIGVITISFIFLISGVPIVIVHDGYNRAYRYIGIIELTAIIGSVLYATRSLVVLRCSGRKHEHIHGMLMASPLYKRLKLMLIVCIVFALPYCFLQLALLGMQADQVDCVPDFIVGITTMLYYLFGAAQAVVMGGSQQCCLRMLAPLIPTHVKNSPEWINLRASRRRDAFLSFDDAAVAAPPDAPVFVITDIEASSELWATAPADVMDTAQEIHDDLLRLCLPKYRGYEITTVGDSFQLAFHTIADAVAYALDVQVQLLQAKWPSELEGLVAATKTEWSIDHLKPHTIFRGLRVRMGIHDTHVADEGTLVKQIHLVTGKTLYIGASELIARELGDAGFGGQVLVSARIAHWLRTAGNAKLIPTPFVVDPYETHAVQQLEMDIELFELTPKAIDARRRVFRKRRGLEESRIALEFDDDVDVSAFEDTTRHSESTTDESVAAGSATGGSDYKSQRTPTAAIRAGLAAFVWRKG